MFLCSVSVSVSFFVSILHAPQTVRFAGALYESNASSSGTPSDASNTFCGGKGGPSKAEAIAMAMRDRVGSARFV